MSNKWFQQLAIGFLVLFIALGLYYYYRIPPSISISKLALKTLDGKPFPNSILRNKVVIVDFYQTWCGPCMAELPELAKTAELYPDDMGVLCLSDEDSTKLIALAHKYADSKIIFLQTVNPLKGLGVHTYPTNYIFNRQGKKVLEKTGPVDWQSSEMMMFYKNQVGGN
ncbi:MAG: TlpA family protein disulfide reductase [Chitinophagales bacterium]|nr:TlpA family protein disulfide reductase [Chitinophagales bacterium]